MACSRIGAIFVPINPRLKYRQLCYVLRDCAARVLVLGMDTSSGGMLEDCGDLELVVEVDTPMSGEWKAKHGTTYSELLAQAISMEPGIGCIDKDPMAIMCTSSSTGPPKGVVFSHQKVVSGAHCIVQYLSNSHKDRILAALPLSFDYGFSQVSSGFSVGACAVLTYYSLPSALLQEIDRESITGLEVRLRSGHILPPLSGPKTPVRR